MNRWIRWLSLLLAVQVLLTLALGLFHGGLSAAPPAGKPLVAATDGVDRLTIEGPDNARVVLQKQAGAWQLPDETDFPADAARVQQVLQHIGAVKTGAVVSTTRQARQRFRVADGAFERRVTLAAGGRTVAKFYLGDSSSAHDVHLRRDGENAVYDVDLGAWEFPATAADWEDKSVLQIPEEDIRSIEVNGLTLTRAAAPAASPSPATGGAPAAAGPAAWRAQGLGKGESLADAAAATLAQRIAGLQIGSVLGSKEDASYGLAKPALQFSVTRTSGRTIDYRLGLIAGSMDYALKSSARDEYFRLPEAAAKELIDGAQRQTLAPRAGSAKKQKAPP